MASSSEARGRWLVSVALALGLLVAGVLNAYLGIGACGENVYRGILPGLVCTEIGIGTGGGRAAVAFIPPVVVLAVGLGARSWYALYTLSAAFLGFYVLLFALLVLIASA